MGGTSIEPLQTHVGPTIPTQQFGVSLKSILNYYQVEIPPVVKQCVEYLDKPDGKLNKIYTCQFFFNILCIN